MARRCTRFPGSSSHGGTRNLIMRLAHGSHVAFLTQDATPADDGWLAALLEGFEQAPDVAAVFGPHLARPDAPHMIAEGSSSTSRPGGAATAIDVQRLERTARDLAAYRAEPREVHVSLERQLLRGPVGMGARSFRDVAYAEDQLLGRELIEAGFAKVFHPGAAVVHSHHYPPSDVHASLLRRVPRPA